MDRESFCRIRERNWTHSGRIEAFEQIHARGNHRRPRRDLTLWNEEGKAGPQHRERQEGEGGEEQRSTTECVNREESWQSEDPVQNACAHGDQQSAIETVPALFEDRGAVVRDYLIEISAITLGIWRRLCLQHTFTPQNCWPNMISHVAKVARLFRGMLKSS